MLVLTNNTRTMNFRQHWRKNFTYRDIGKHGRGPRTACFLEQRRTSTKTESCLLFSAKSPTVQHQSWSLKVVEKTTNIHGDSQAFRTTFKGEAQLQFPSQFECCEPARKVGLRYHATTSRMPKWWPYQVNFLSHQQRLRR